MKLVNTLPFRPDISNLLFSDMPKKIFAIVLIACLITFNSSCSRLDEAESISFEIWYKGDKLDCNTFENNQQVWSIQQLAFFISNIKLSAENTVNQPKLSSTPWQTNDVVLMQPSLVDCETQSKSAEVDKSIQINRVNSVALKTNNNVQFAAPVDLDASEHLSFTLAVPFALNHQNPLLQPSPLNLPSMFWSWRSGHKFLRLDMQGPNNNWAFHLGSVGCSAVSTMRSPQEECVQPNRVSFHLDKKYNGSKLVLHIDRLMANTPMENGGSCLFHSDQQSCTILMSNLKTQDVFEWH